jgi:hypothetical protein
VRLTDLSFEQWLEHAFGQAVRFQQNAWFFDPDSDWWDPEPAQALAYLTRLFEDPEPALAWFSDDQIAQGLTYLVSCSTSGDNGWFYATTVPIEQRVRCVEAVGAVFARLFAPRCTAHLSHLSEAGAGTLNVVCYMWWDDFPCLALPDDPHRSVLHDAALRTMEQILTLRSLAGQESALHGLGHWQRQHADPVVKIIDRFLDAHPALDPRLAAYARSARCGCVL